MSISRRDFGTGNLLRKFKLVLLFLGVQNLSKTTERKTYLITKCMYDSFE